jgi:hypothetical protein
MPSGGEQERGDLVAWIRPNIHTDYSTLQLADRTQAVIRAQEPGWGTAIARPSSNW